MDPLEWPIFKLVQDRVVSEESSISYQGAGLKSYTIVTLENFKKQALGDHDMLHKAIQERLEWSVTGVLRVTIPF